MRFVRQVRCDLLKFALGCEPAADILIDKDVAGFDEKLAGAELAGILVYAVGTYVIWRAFDENRIGFCRITRYKYRRHQLDAIAHRHHRFVLRIVQADVAFKLFRLLSSQIIGEYKQAQVDEQKKLSDAMYRF